ESPTPEPPASEAPAPEAPAPEAPAPAPQPEGGGGGGESSNRTLMIVLSYLGLLALIPLLMEKEDQEVQWHAKHGLVLFGFWVVLGLVLSVLSAVPVLGCLTILVSLFLPIAALVVHIICIVKGINGDRFLIPAISDFADKF
ncbi:MAG: hypothetical protein ACE5EG_12085, partial [Thermoanaerobaculia bacterium]